MTPLGRPVGKFGAGIAANFISLNNGSGTFRCKYCDVVVLGRSRVAHSISNKCQKVALSKAEYLQQVPFDDIDSDESSEDNNFSLSSDSEYEESNSSMSALESFNSSPYVSSAEMNVIDDEGVPPNSDLDSSSTSSTSSEEGGFEYLQPAFKKHSPVMARPTMLQPLKKLSREEEALVKLQHLFVQGNLSGT